MKNLEAFLRPTQKQLFHKLRYMFDNTVWKTGAYILVRGDAPVMLVAHMDTVHNEAVKQICKSDDGNILMSPQGIGGDDRCGVYALVRIYELSEKKPWLLFTCDEEIGGVGAMEFCKAYEKGKLPKKLADLKMIIEIDRKGSNDAVYYDCDNIEFEDYITSKGYVTDFGSFSDISYIAPALGVAAVNLSSGYYGAHQLHEYINRNHLESTIKRVVSIVDESSDIPNYEYIERVSMYSDFYHTSNIGFMPPKRYKKEVVTKYIESLPPVRRDMYDELMYYFDEGELFQYVKENGDDVIPELYNETFGSLI